MNKQNIVSVVASLIAIVIAISLIFRDVNVTVQVVQVPDQFTVGSEGTRFPQGLSTDSTSPSNGQVRTTTLTVTGAATLDSSIGGAGSGTTTISGVEFYPRNAALTTATTTPWNAFPTASSTLIAAWCRITGSTTASTLTLAKATTQYGTTTAHATSSCAANAQCTINVLATTTQNASLGATAVNDRSYGPADRLVLSQEGGIGNFSPTGGCFSIFAAP